MQNIERAKEGPGENDFAVVANSPIGGNAVRSLEYPIGNIAVIMRPKDKRRQM
jgi:hypothetical protein